MKASHIGKENKAWKIEISGDCGCDGYSPLCLLLG